MEESSWWSVSDDRDRVFLNDSDILELNLRLGLFRISFARIITFLMKNHCRVFYTIMCLHRVSSSVNQKHWMYFMYFFRINFDFSTLFLIRNIYNRRCIYIYDIGLYTGCGCCMCGFRLLLWYGVVNELESQVYIVDDNVSDGENYDWCVYIVAIFIIQLGPTINFNLVGRWLVTSWD